MQPDRFILWLGVISSLAGIFSFGWLAISLVNQMRQRSALQTIKWALLGVFIATIVTFGVGLGFDVVSLAMNSYKGLNYYILTNIIIRFVVAGAIPFIFFYKVRD